MHEEICPSCGIAYQKWLDKLDAAKAPRKPPPPLEDQPRPPSRADKLLYTFFFVPSDRDESAFWGHLVLYAIFLAWGWIFILSGLNRELIHGSILHLASIPIHEYGHVMFSPLGELSMFLGGSMLQILLPFFLIILFSVYRRENFAASVMLWWMGQNFIDVAPYIQDATLREMVLTGGRGADQHDWWNVLRITGQMGLADFYARLWFLLGALLIVLSNIWGACLLYIELKGRGAIPDRDDLHGVSESDPE